MMTKTLHYWGADESRDKDNASPTHVLADAQAHGSEQQANITYESSICDESSPLSADSQPCVSVVICRRLSARNP
jgi:hypothetical protein